jgi:uncharacterized protein (DUF4415 family)
MPFDTPDKARAAGQSRSPKKLAAIAQNGAVKTDKKAKASKENGKQGGRPLAGNSRQVTFRLDADLLSRLLDYEEDVPDYSRTSTLNAALQLFLDVADLEEEDWNRVQHLLSKTFPER